MGEKKEQAIEKGIIASQRKDETKAQKIILGDRTINDMERNIEARCLSLILRQQPGAKDLRIVTTALEVVTDMERIGDHAADISELVIKNRFSSNYEMIRAIPEMAEVAKQMVHDAVEGFIQCNIESAQKTALLDDKVDDLFNVVKQDVIHSLKHSGEKAARYIGVLMRAKYLERIGDHAVNICE